MRIGLRQFLQLKAAKILPDFAFFFRLDGIPEDAATDYLVAYYNDPAGDFTADEIKRTVKSVYSR